MLENVILRGKLTLVRKPTWAYLEPQMVIISLRPCAAEVSVMGDPGEGHSAGK